MIIRSYQHATEFLARVQPALEEHEIVNNLMLGLCLRIAASEEKDPDKFQGKTLYRSVHNEYGVIALTLQTPGRAMILSQHQENVTDAFSMLVADLYQNNRDPIGVVAPQTTALRFAQLWQVVSGKEPRLYQQQRLYQCSAVTNFDLAPGKLRKAQKKEIPMLIDWSMEFSEITSDKPTKAELEASLTKDIEAGAFYVWDEAGRAVSMLKENRPTINTVAVSYVFTPKEQRKRGYATAAVHALTDQLLKSGYQACTLFTDLGNPTSNHIYQQIGYTPVIDFDHYLF